MKPYLLGQGVSIFVDGFYSCPSSHVAAIDTISSMLNPYFILWKQHDQVTMHECSSFFFVTEILHLMVDRYTSHSIWKTLKKAFTSPSHTRIVVTQFWTSRAEDGVYLFWIECRSLAHIRQKIDKGTGRNILKPCLSCFLLFLSFPFTTKIIRFS